MNTQLMHSATVAARRAEPSRRVRPSSGRTVSFRAERRRRTRRALARAHRRSSRGRPSAAAVTRRAHGSRRSIRRGDRGKRRNRRVRRTCAAECPSRRGSFARGRRATRAALGIGRALSTSCSTRARRDGFETALRVHPRRGLLRARGFSIVPHAWVPEKIALDCHELPAVSPMRPARRRASLAQAKRSPGHRAVARASRAARCP